MSEMTPGMAVAIRALSELPADEREVYRACFVLSESREATCVRLQISEERYDTLYKGALRSMRAMVQAEVAV